MLKVLFLPHSSQIFNFTDLSLIMETATTAATEEIIVLNDVNIFQKNHLVLEQINVSVRKGEFVFIIGKNGSGKSSFLKTLYGELKLENGQGAVGGLTLNKIKKKNIPFLRRKIGIVFQDFQLLTDRSIFDNLLFVLKATGWKNKNDIEKRIDDVLHHVGLTDKKRNCMSLCFFCASVCSVGFR